MPGMPPLSLQQVADGTGTATPRAGKARDFLKETKRLNRQIRQDPKQDEKKKQQRRQFPERNFPRHRNKERIRLDRKRKELIFPNKKQKNQLFMKILQKRHDHIEIILLGAIHYRKPVNDSQNTTNTKSQKFQYSHTCILQHETVNTQTTE